jgi:hypothetical protein
MKFRFPSKAFKLFLIVLSFLNFQFSFAQVKKNPSKETLVYIRVEISTSSDWTILRWENFDKIKTMRVFAVEGKNPEFQVFYDKIKLAQKILNQDQSSKILVDYLINTDKDEKWSYSLLRGELGETNVKILVKKDFQFEQIHAFNHTQKILEDLSENKITNQVIFNFDSNYVYMPEKVQTVKIPKLVLAFYYLWYTKDNWKIFPLDDQPLNFYSSDDEKTITNQIKLAKANGIDGFITSWDGPNSYSDHNFKKLLKLCNKLNFKTTIYYETLTEIGPRDDEEIYNHLKYLIQTYGSDKSFINILGKPLIVIWASNEMDIARWRKIISSLKKENLDAAFIGMDYDISNLEIFDGIHQYGIVLIDNLQMEYQQVSEIVKNYHLFGMGRKIWAATVQPGYDERRIPNRKGIFKERDSGKYFEETFKTAINSNPDLIFITSWNEWWEHTYIEPSKKYKNRYLSLTRKYSNLWKSKK